MKSFALLLVFLFLFCAVSEAQIPRTLSYQGVLTDTSGVPKPDGVYALTFRLYATSVGGSAIWTEAKSVPVKHGLFTTVLGDTTPFPPEVKFDAPYWLGIQVSIHPELRPRIALTSTAYSLNAATADTAKFALGSTGLDQTAGDARYLQLTGGTLSDGLIIHHGTNQYGLSIMNWMGGINAVQVSQYDNWAGIYCYNNAPSGTTWGVSGIADGSSGSGVTGSSNNGVGVVARTRDGKALTAAVAVGGSGVAALFTGNVQVVGTLSKSAGSFKIDHPLDPANKYLYHSFVESPDMMNVYNGNVTTDAAGNATITLPGYFQTLNRDFRYQLTVIGQFAQAIVQTEIQNNQFTIKTDKPGVKVSWQVTGIRQDPYANAHRIMVEENKPAAEQGTYLYPEGYGQSPTKAINYELNSRGTGGRMNDETRSVQGK